MDDFYGLYRVAHVVPRVGGRGLKFHNSNNHHLERKRRPPRRGTWIEIALSLLSVVSMLVVPRVGGRGLKLFLTGLILSVWRRPPRRGTWIEMCIEAKKGTFRHRVCSVQFP